MKAKRATLWALFGSLGLLWGSTAEAQEQPWLVDRRFTDGRGVRTGDYVFHFGVAGEFGYDSNILLRANTREEPRVGAFRLAPSAYVTFNNRLPPAEGGGGVQARPPYYLTGRLGVTYNQFFHADGAQADIVGHSGSRSIGGLGAVSLSFAPAAKLGANLNAAILRSIEPSQLGDPSATYNRTTPRLGGSAVWRPGGGLFEWNVVGYEFAHTWFDQAPFTRLDNSVHSIYSRGNWRFRPRTALVFDSTLGLIRYNDEANAGVNNGDTVISRIGVNGLVTNSIGVTGMGGWGAAWFNAYGGAPAQRYDSFVAQAEVRFYLASPPRNASSDAPTIGGAGGTTDTPGVYPTILAFGYSRDVSQSYLTSFYSRDRGYASLAYFFNGALLGSLSGGIARVYFPQAFFTNGVLRADASTGAEYDATAMLEYRPALNIGINVRGSYTRLESSQIFSSTPGAVVDLSTSDRVGYERYQAMLGLRYLM